MRPAEQELVELAARLEQLPHTRPELAGFFDGADEVLLSRAPGRLERLFHVRAPSQLAGDFEARRQCG